MKIDKIKAWKDEEYRSTLTADQLAIVNNPVASLELSDEQMGQVNGGAGVGVTFSPWNPRENPGNDMTYSDCCSVQ